MNYNPYQLMAIEHGEGPALVLAGPGSGKTAVVTERAKRLIDRGIPAENILVITFTKAAATEMTERFRKLAGEQGKGITFGTFHSVFFRILRQEYDYSAGNILREGERIRILGNLLLRHFPDLETEPEFLTELLTEISAVKNGAKSVGAERKSGDRVDFPRIYRLYNEAVHRSGKLDFDDMLIKTLELLRNRPEVLQYWRQKYQHIMVDEFQDINRIQYETVKLLASPRYNVFAVGDDDQSIYRFRGSEPQIMLEFGKEFPNVKKLELPVNYRSDSAVVGASLKLINHNKNRYAKKLVSASQREGEVRIKEYEDETVECRDITEEILELQANSFPLHEIAVLVRTNRGAETMLQAFTEHSVPFYTRDQMPNIFRHPACQPIFGYLNYSLGNRTRENFLKFMNCPLRGIRREDLLKVDVNLQELSAYYEKNQDRAWLSKRMLDFEKQLQLLSMLKNPYAMINYIRKGIGLDRYLEENSEKKKTDYQEIEEVLDAVQQSSREYGSVEAWYEHIATYTKELTEASRAGKISVEGRVTVSTLHGAKGLEFSAVYIPDVNEHVLPHEKSVKAEEIEEERRLFYVGMTRAKKSLRLSSVKERFGKKTEASRFLSEIK